MEVILLERMRNLGALGAKVKVKRGFARNFLIPTGKAVYANKENTEKFEARRAELEKRANERHGESVAKQKALEALTVVTITAKAGDEGKLFGSVGTRDIAAAITKAGVEIEKREVLLPEGTLRTLGEHEVTIDLDGDITAQVKLTIVNEA